VQVEGEITEAQLVQLRAGVCIQKRQTLGARADRLGEVPWEPRVPPIRYRSLIPTGWLELSLREGRNRQVRRMTAAVGLPTLRLIRVAVELHDHGPPLSLAGLTPGQWRHVSRQEQRRLEHLLRQDNTSIS
jgi:23S rRNA pseudouridine2457 synthase